MTYEIVINTSFDINNFCFITSTQVVLFSEKEDHLFVNKYAFLKETITFITFKVKTSFYKKKVCYLAKVCTLKTTTNTQISEHFKQVILFNCENWTIISGHTKQNDLKNFKTNNVCNPNSWLKISSPLLYIYI